jgi:hypothetical protein
MKSTIDMAREAGIIDPRDAFSEAHVQAVLQDLKAFEALVRADAIADEREACAKVCDDLSPPCGYNLTEISFWDVTSLECAAAIRARSNT